MIGSNKLQCPIKLEAVRLVFFFFFAMLAFTRVNTFNAVPKTLYTVKPLKVLLLHYVPQVSKLKTELLGLSQSF